MTYADLIETMHQYRVGNIDRVDMVAAIALWQRPVECARINERKRLLAILYQVPFSFLWPGQKDPGDNYKMAIEGVIR